MGDSAGQEYCVDLTFEGNRHGSDFLCYGVAHGAEYEHGVEVALVDTVDDFEYGGCAEMGVKTAFSVNYFHELVFGILSGETQVDERTRGQRAGAFRREGTAAVEGVCGVDDATVAVGRNGAASAHVAHDEIERFV